MEKGAVTIGIDKYNELRDFKKNIEEGKVVMSYWNYDAETRYRVLTISDAVKEIIDSNNELEKKNESLSFFNNFDHEERQLKKMSFWQWRKWRKS